MANLQKIAKSAYMLGGTDYSHPTNGRRYESTLRRQYFEKATQAYVQEVGAYATDTYEAQVQGLNPNDFYEWRPVLIRSATASTSTTGELMPDDWQRVKIIKPSYLDYLPQGAYLKYAHNTWLVYKGKNMSAVIGGGICRRCNSVVNVMDWYGKVVSVPMSYAKMGTLGNASHASENTITSKNYISCMCQLNEYSKDWTENTRLILGKAAYAMRGLDDFTREFTDEQDSGHLLTFTIERTQPMEQDNMELQVADYWSFSWRLDVSAVQDMVPGGTQQLSVSSVRNGVNVSSSREHPIRYLYESSDESVLTVDDTGMVTAVSAGNAVITVTLEQNERFSTTVDMYVSSTGETGIEFTNPPAPIMRAFESDTISAAFVQDGAITDQPVTFTFCGANPKAYSVVDNGNNSCTLTVYSASNTLLTVTASCCGHSATAEVALMA